MTGDQRKTRVPPVETLPHTETVRAWFVGVDDEPGDPQHVTLLVDVASGHEPRRFVMLSVDADHALALGEAVVEAARSLHDGEPGHHLHLSLAG
jgi:hypothetical protein